MNFNKNETESKMENPTHSFREANLAACASAHKESQIESKTVMSWGLQKKKEGIFCTIYFVERNLFLTCVLSRCIVY